MIQGTSVFNNPLAGGLPITSTGLSTTSNTLAASSYPNLGLGNPTALLESGGSSSILQMLLPLISEMLQMLTSVLEGGGNNPYSGSLSNVPSPAPAPDPQPSPAPVPSPAPQPAPSPTSPTPPSPSPSGDVGDAGSPPPSGSPSVPSPTPSSSQPTPNPSPTESPPANGPSPASAPSSGTTSAPTTQPPNSINVKDFGAKGDGSSDDQAALQKAFDQAKATGQSVWIPPGTYNHSGVLNVDGTKVSGSGNQTVLNATNPDQESIKLTGEGCAVSNLKTTVSAPCRSSQPDDAAILVQNASNASVSNITAQGAASNGIRLDNATGANISHNLVEGSNADGIALMNGSSGNTVSNNAVYQAGDDSYSDDSYTSDAKQDTGNTFENNLSQDNAYGRGMCFAGSANDTVKGNTISGSKWYGIFAQGDPNSGTMQTSGINISNNTVINNPNGAPVQADGQNVSGTNTNGSLPSVASILGWDPDTLTDRSTFTQYVPGTGDGANNSGGSRS